MRSRTAHSLTARAIIGMIALYGLLLQAVFVSALPANASGLLGAICQPHDGGDGPAQGQPIAHDHQCCTAAHLGGMGLPPVATQVRHAALPVAAAVIWRDGVSPASTGPSVDAQSARGPPSA